MAAQPPPLLVRDGLILSQVPGAGPVRGDLLVQGGRIAALGPGLAAPPGAVLLDAAGAAVLPGLVQAHLHLCQTLFRGLAEGLELLPWLRERILPLEAAHDERSLAASARLALTELLLSGTTAFQSMETSHGTQAVLEVVAETGMAAVAGPCLLDEGEGVPARLLRPAAAALAEVAALARSWHRAGSAIAVALNPRFVLTCSEGLLREAAGLAAAAGLRIHTHAAENPAEAAAARARTGMSDVAWLHRLGLLGPRTGLAHCIHVDPAGEEALLATGTHVLTCPTANLKLASGIAPIHRYLSRGIPVALGADGAACNNRLDGWTEMRILALLQKLLAGPAALSAREALALATRGGARALGREAELGTLEPGKRADLIVVDLEAPWLGPGGEPETRLVHAAGPRDIRAVVVAGRLAVERGRLLLWDQEEAAARGREELARLQARL